MQSMVRSLYYAGVVVSTNMQKTVTVAVKKMQYNKRVHRDMPVKRKLLAHDEHESCRLGDQVQIIPAGRRLSPRKSWVVYRITKPVGRMEDYL